eukprot:1187573-Prorocentrum_minimum.AAC.3
MYCAVQTLMDAFQMRGQPPRLIRVRDSYHATPFVLRWSFRVGALWRLLRSSDQSCAADAAAAGMVSRGLRPSEASSMLWSQAKLGCPPARLCASLMQRVSDPAAGALEYPGLNSAACY